ncbi:MAG: MFS transporter [Deltaproteobacteria bacterium]|nr:MFS transporter [Deltaproteobacteria bacterium]
MTQTASQTSEQTKTGRWPLLVVSAGFLLAAMSLGTRHVFGLYLPPMTETYGWGREVFALAMAVQTIVWGAAQPLAGGLADRFGSGRVLVAGALIYALGLFMVAHADTPLTLILTLGVVVALGISGTGYPIALGAVSRAVSEKQRSLYLGVVMAGGSVGMFTMVPIGQGFMNGLGWQNSLAALGALALLMCLLALALTGKAEPPGPEQINSPWKALNEAAREPRYWLLFWGFFVCGFHVVFIATHLPAYLMDQGLSPGMGAFALSLVGFFNILGTLGAGWLGGRVSKRYSLSLIYLVRSVIIAVFVLLPTTELSTTLFAAAMGLVWVSTVPLTSGLVGQMYDVRYLSTLFGLVLFGHQIGGFMGVWVGGLVFDMAGSYQVVWWIAVGLGVFAALLHYPIDERHYSTIKAARIAPVTGPNGACCRAD